MNLFFPKFLLKNVNHIKHENTNISSSEINKNYYIHTCQHSVKCDICRVTKQHIKNNDIDFLLSTHQKVKESGLYNFQGCKIPVNNNLNIHIYGIC